MIKKTQTSFQSAVSITLHQYCTSTLQRFSFHRMSESQTDRIRLSIHFCTFSTFILSIGDLKSMFKLKDQQLLLGKKYSALFLLPSVCLRVACDQAFLCSQKRDEHLMDGYFAWKEMYLIRGFVV